MLRIVADENVREHYVNWQSSYAGDLGIDLIAPEDITVHKYGTINFGIKCEPSDNTGYWLVPRSSISKTPLIMHNSIGIIDSGYRGYIMAKVVNLGEEPYKIVAGTRLFQLIHPSGKTLRCTVVDELSATTRGEGGFGSTG